MRSRKLHTLLVAVLLVTAASLAPAVAAGEDDTAVAPIETDHGLAAEDAVHEFEATGAVSGAVDGLQLSLTVAEDKDRVGVEGMSPIDTRNDYLRIQYEEDLQRTLVIWLPGEYITPYTRETVESLTTDHHADLEPVRDGEYLQVTITLGGPADVVIPLDKSAATTYSILDRVGDRVEAVTGLAMSGDKEWQYVESERLANHTAVELDVDPDSAVIQYDASGDETDELWLNMAEEDKSSSEVYWYYDADKEAVVVVPKTDDPPAIRYKERGSVLDAASGAVNDARHTARKVLDSVTSTPWGDSEE